MLRSVQSRRDEPPEQRMGFVGAGFELRVVLHAHEEGPAGKLDRLYQPAVRGAEMGDGGAYVYRLGGNSCLSGDYMGLWSFDHELQIGERIIFEDMIHYTMVKTNMFNGIHHPAIAMWTKEGKAEIFRKFSYEDYRNRMS